MFKISVLLFICWIFKAPDFLIMFCNCSNELTEVKAGLEAKNADIEEKNTTIVQVSLKDCHITLNKMPTNWWGRQDAAPLKVDPKPLEAVFSAVFRSSVNADWK